MIFFTFVKKHVKLISLLAVFLLATIFPLLSLYSSLVLQLPRKLKLHAQNLTPLAPQTEIDIEFSDHGIPHIFSETIQGSLYGLGYMHARDRLWQTEVKRLAAYGRLAEHFGEEILFVDKFFRTLGLLDVCKRNLEYIERNDPETLLNLRAYSQGINDYVQDVGKPLEFVLVGVEWEDWTALDSLMLIKFAFVNLIIDWTAELLRARIADYYPAEFVEVLVPGRSHLQYDFSDSINDEELKLSGLFEEKHIDLNEQFQFVKRGEWHNKARKPKDSEQRVRSSLYEILNPGTSFSKGSNTWVIHGNHTKSGEALLAGDPHLDNNIPSIWYLAELKYLREGEEQFVIGATMSGIPFIVFGRSQYLSWSGAIAIGDNSDAFEELLNDDETKYYFNGDYHDLLVSEQEIKVKGKSDPYKLTVKRTRHGPLVDCLLSDVAEREVCFDRHYSFAWGGFKDEEDSLTSFYNLYKINKWDPDQVIGAFANLTFTSISANIATNDGHIAGVITSAWLKKKSQSPVADFFPKDGTDPENEWIGLIDPKEKPFIIDPPKGYIFQANNKFTGDGYKYESASNYITTSRASRIQELIEEAIQKGRKLGVDDMMEMQMDTVDVYARDLAPKMMNIVKELKAEFAVNEQRELDELLDMIENWDAKNEIDQVDAAIFNTWEYLFRSHLLLDLDEQVQIATTCVIYEFDQFLLNEITKWNSSIHQIHSDYNSSQKEINICPQVNYTQITNQQHLKLISQHCAFLLPVTLLMTKEYLTRELGKDPNDWQWGTLHQIRYLHLPFSEVPVLKQLYERRRPGAGNFNTINCGNPKFKSRSFESCHGPNFRIISETNSELYLVIDTGQSENVFSENYFDQGELFAKGQYIQMDFGNFLKKKNQQ